MTAREFWEGMGGGLFLRRWLPYGFQTDVGVRATWGSHFDSSDDDEADASFKGLFGSLFWGTITSPLGRACLPDYSPSPVRAMN